VRLLVKTIYADFNNIDSDGLLRLNNVGTISDLNRAGIALQEGVVLTFSDGDLVAKGVVRTPSSEGVWRAQILGEISDRGEGST
jgi:hypothetical protein